MLEIQGIADHVGVDRAAQNAAYHELETAIDNFRMHYPNVRQGRRTRGTIADQRDALSSLSAALRTSLSSVQSLPLDARAAFCRRIESPIGKVTKLLKEWSEASSAEYLKAQKSEDRPADDAPSVLAFDVARILERKLQTKATLTSDRNTNGLRGGAAYCRLLRVTMQAAGAEAASDLLPAMRCGKKLLENFSLDAE